MIETEQPSFGEAVRFWSKLGWISFGGTAAHIAIMHDFLVERKGWIDEDRFLHALSHCMMLPGPEAQQLSIYIGWKLHGIKGGMAAGVLFVLPSMFILLALSIVYVSFGKLAWISAMFGGLKPAVIALVVLALFKIGRRALRNIGHWVVAAAAFTGMFFFDVSLPAIMFAVIVLGGLFYGFRKEPREAAPSSSTPFDVKPIVKLLAIALPIWLLPFGLFYFSGDFPFWSGLGLFFTKAACVTIGGSYTVIPYVAQVSVAKLHWLANAQMMDGFALAETTPGPLIIVVSYVGFMAAFNHFHGSLWMGTLGLLVTTFFTFLPCFVFVFAGAPIVERTEGNPVVKGVLGLITAVVVGAILDLTLYLGKGILFPSGNLAVSEIDFVAAGWILVSLLLIWKFRLNVIYLIGLSVGFGALRWVAGS